MVDSKPSVEVLQAPGLTSDVAAGGLAGVARRGGEDDGGAPDEGLVSSFISRRSSDDSQGASFGVEVVPGGVIVKRLGCDGGNPDPAKRGAICDYSRASKRRHMERLMRLDWSNLAAQSKRAKCTRAFFVTLTYPEMDFKTWQAWKAHLDAFHHRLVRMGDKFSGADWKLEPQPDRSIESGEFVPHFHLLVAFKDPVAKKWFREWLSQAWYEIVGSGNPDHLKAGTRADVVYGTSGRLMAYLAKYLGKEFEFGELACVCTGRVWGTWGELPQGKCKALVLTEAQAVEVMRRLRAWGKRSRYLRGVGRRNNLYYITEGQEAGPLGFLAFGVGSWVLRGLHSVHVFQFQEVEHVAQEKGCS